MASPEDLESRTEPASQRRRDEARQEGRVTFSAELAGGLLLLADHIAAAAWPVSAWTASIWLRI